MFQITQKESHLAVFGLALLKPIEGDALISFFFSFLFFGKYKTVFLRFGLCSLLSLIVFKGDVGERRATFVFILYGRVSYVLCCRGHKW